MGARIHVRTVGGALLADRRVDAPFGFPLLDLGMVRAMESVRYAEIAEASPTQEDFEYGWQLNRGIRGSVSV